MIIEIINVSLRKVLLNGHPEWICDCSSHPTPLSRSLFWARLTVSSNWEVFATDVRHVCAYNAGMFGVLFGESTFR